MILRKLLFLWVVLSISQKQYAQYTLNNDAFQMACNEYRLTQNVNGQRGSVWNNTKINLTQSFDFNFSVFLGNNDSPGADGMAFVLQPISTSVGTSGGGMGFQGVTPSVGVTIDTYQNGSDNDPTYDHIAIQLNGNISHTSILNIAGPVTAINGNNNIEDGVWHSFRVVWDAPTKTYTAYIDGNLRVNVVKDFVADVFAGDPLVYWGFTASTGGENNFQAFRTTLAPSYTFSATQKKCVNEPITFTNTSISFSPIVNVYWNFGDGSPVVQTLSPVHTYLTAGDFTVTQRVVALDGCEVTNTQTLRIGSKPISGFLNDNNCNLGVVNFTDTSHATVGTINNWYWDFDNAGATSTLQNPSTTYSFAGPKVVKLAVKSLEGCLSDTLVKTIQIYTAPAAPTVAASPIAYCQNAAAVALTATGTNLLWYSSASGGTGSSTAIIPATTTAGSIAYYVGQTVNGCESPRAAIVVDITATPATPTVTTPIAYCQSTTATALTATGTNLLWYTTATGGIGSTTAPTPITITSGSTTYYVSQSQNGCESPRATIVVDVTATPAIPVAATPIAYCQGSTATALAAGGTNLLWYTIATGGVGSSTAPTPTTTSLGSTTYYVSQTINNCEGPRTAIVVNVAVTPIAPSVITPITYCQGASALVLTATGTNLLWYTQPVGGVGLINANAPFPSTATAGSTVYYVSQSIGTCEGPRASITVDINVTPPVPIVTPYVHYCKGSTPAQLTATGSNLLWYPSFTGGIGNTTAPTPSTLTPGSTTYYVNQTIGSCPGPRGNINVTILALPSPLVVNTPVVYCKDSTASVVPGTGVFPPASDTIVYWSTFPSGGIPNLNGLLPSTSTVGSTNYYLFNGVNNFTLSGFLFCEGPRTTLTVIVNPPSALPTVVTPISYCQNAPTIPLTATGINLLWYTTATGGVGSSVAPVPSSATAGTTSYYVSQRTGNCEGPRAMIDVNIVATPAAPIVSPKIYCPSDVALPLTAIGTNLLWYTTATGGVGTSTAPTPNTTIFPTTYNYYVSQSTGTCEGPRALLVVTIDNPLTVNIGRDTTICEGDTVKFNPVVTPAATNYAWRAIAVPQNTINNISIIDATVRPVDTASYILRATLGGCSKEDTVNVNVRWKPKLDVGLTRAICLKDSTFLVGVVTHNSGIISTYRWTPIDSLRTDTLIQTWAYPTKTTYYKLTIATTLADYGCVFTASDSVKLIVQPIVHAFAGNDTIAVKGAAHKLLGSGGVNYNWSSPTALLNNPFVQYPITTLTNNANFYLEVRDAIGCVGYDTVFVKVYNGPTYYVPNTFTPNGDGLNDIFRAIPVGIANTTYFSVFNRYGELMFETNQWLKGWDGTFKGKPQPNGTYVWMVSGTDKDFKKVEMKGTVNLIR